MAKTLDTIRDAISSKHPFRQVDSRPQKSQKRRYERRKVKEYIRLADWGMDISGQAPIGSGV